MLVVVLTATSLAVVAVAVAVSERRARRRLLDGVEERTRRLRPDGPEPVDLRPDAVLARFDRAVESLRAEVDQERAGWRRLDLALRAIPEGVVVVDASGEVVFRNDVAQGFEGARHGDALVEGAVRDLVTSTAASGVGDERTLDLFGPPRRTLVIRSVPLGEVGDPVGALAVIADVSERRRLESVRRDFVANISHELKTPVGALSLLAETLLAEEDSAVRERLAERVLTEATRVAHTIEDLIQLSQIEAEEAPEREPVGVHLVIAEAAKRIAPAAEHAGIDVQVSEPSSRLVVSGDRRQLVSAVYNLLDNAVKYTDRGGWVAVRTATDGSHVDIIVEDRGIGIPARDLERIFERFYRVDQARSRATGGTGLGLAIVRHAMTNHGGEVLVRSRMGEGSTFTLRLPLAGGPVAVDRPGDVGAGAGAGAGFEADHVAEAG